MIERGIILKSISGFYDVKTENETVRCTARGRFRREKITPLVGDRVSIEVSGQTGVIDEIAPRKNSFIRPPVANIENLVIIASNVIPVTDPFLIDRIIVASEYADCEPIICINKSDMDSGDNLYDIYKKAGFITIRTSAATGEGIEELKKVIKGKICAFTGNSGVGKSSILNILDPELNLPVGDVSEKLGRGRHTTRCVELFEFPDGTLVADTPGFSAFDPSYISHIPADKLQYTFRDFKKYIGKCRFVDCAHIKEDDCAVLNAVKNGEISESRHNSYRHLYEQAKEVNEWELK